jgi:uncharacterized membrane protein
MLYVYNIILFWSYVKLKEGVIKESIKIMLDPIVYLLQTPFFSYNHILSLVQVVIFPTSKEGIIFVKISTFNKTFEGCVCGA